MESTSFDTGPWAALAPEEPVVAELVEEIQDHDPLESPRSWVFCSCAFLSRIVNGLFGIVSVIFCTAVVANVPVFQFLSLGYLFEVSGRIGRGGNVTSALVGLEKASRIGGVVLGTWLLLIPVRFFSSNFWYEAYLIDPTSTQTQTLRIVQILLIVITITHVVAAWACGGKLRYFFWPLIAPFSFGFWLFRRLMGTRWVRPLLTLMFRWISPGLTEDICDAQSPQDWFVPAILWKRVRAGTLYLDMRDGLWEFVGSLRPWHYFKLGLVGFFGTALWLAIPTLLLIGATNLEGPAAVVSATVGIIVAVPVFSLLMFMQVHYATHHTLWSFLDLGFVLKNYRKAPLAHLGALLIALAFALPLFLAKIEEIPEELLWTLSIIFVTFSWPSRIVVALAYRRGTRKSENGRWWLRLPQMALAFPISAAFVGILFLTRYTSWNGAYSMIENHVFLLPAPFWL